MQMKFLPFYWPLRALKNVLLWIYESLNVRLTSGQTGACLGVWPVKRCFVISPKRPKSVPPWVILKHIPTAVPCFLFHAFIMCFFACSAPQSVSSLWRMRWTALGRSRSTQAKGGLRAVAASPADGMKWSQVSPGSQSPRTSSPLALFGYQNCCVREVTSSRCLVTSEKRPHENMAVVLLLLQLWMFL